MTSIISSGNTLANTPSKGSRIQHKGYPPRVPVSKHRSKCECRSAAGTKSFTRREERVVQYTLSSKYLHSKGSYGLLASATAFVLPDLHSKRRGQVSYVSGRGLQVSGSLEIFKSPDEVHAWSRRLQCAGKTIALVPTMGYLHDGHLSLVRAARQVADIVVVSIYVNPTQFGPGEDLDVYPRDLEGDIAKLTPLCDAVYLPESLYDSSEEGGLDHETWVQVERMQRGLCGASRDGHFRGVATIVTKLLNIVDPTHIIMGKKDYQQYLLIRRMVRDLNFYVEVVGVPLMRHQDGLAMSSRNARLTPEERQNACWISRSLRMAKEMVEEGVMDARQIKDIVTENITNNGGRVDYVEVVDMKTLQAVDTVAAYSETLVAVAAHFGSVRLIDNIELGQAPAET
eukprot:CAMPEP_0197860698 /NCGR_PEP_ID=MMETSP1438-20131217/36250_1 /TAXON_ID=1461541 /ORGANISM="Pterosperma sp., Strain CCMP1384" /LENGTH=398 /DNA_ID=CAMNT_0043477651 /DNA_START=43 /DNA_END=1239 /DNA_ORIENTATION=-